MNAGRLMHYLRNTSAVVAVLWLTCSARAGLYYSGEVLAELPSRWRGFLIDQRALRAIAVKPDNRNPAAPIRLRYQEEAAKLEAAGKERKLRAGELADLGALHIRLGAIPRALEVLRQAQRAHPRHFQIVANLGTAWQLQGDFAAAAECLQQAARLAPGKYQKAEEYQLKLVRLRAQERNRGAFDDLFGIRLAGDSGKYEAGKIAAREMKKLPSGTVAVAQQLALWLPADGRLIWQLAELANAYGDVRTAAAMMDGCVTQFGLSDPELRKHRQVLRAAADALAKTTHTTAHASRLAARSQRPLVSSLVTEKLPAISATGVNLVPWAVLGQTTVDRQYKPTFARYLNQLDGKRIALAGFMQPLNDDPDATAFLLIEYPVGCWYCEMPEMTGIVLVELAGARRPPFTRSLVKVVGRLKLNSTDPESFLYKVGQATVAEAD
jgi:hypothetical protein